VDGELTDQTSLPAINEIVWLLERFNPAALEQLREQYPEETSVLTKGLILGSKPVSATGMKVRISACLTGLKSGINVCEEMLPRTRQKLRRANSLRFASEIITVVAGASIFTVLATNFEHQIRYVVAGLALLGSLLALAATYVGGTFHPAAGNLFDYYKELIDCQVDAKRIQQELEFWKHSDLKDSSIEDAVNSGNDICARIIKAANLAT
jgi:hypothetical protein